eukprot:3617928-Pyramimonas_sp.AAC.1
MPRRNSHRNDAMCVGQVWFLSDGVAAVEIPGEPWSDGAFNFVRCHEQLSFQRSEIAGYYY